MLNKNEKEIVAITEDIDKYLLKNSLEDLVIGRFSASSDNLFGIRLEGTTWYDDEVLFERFIRCIMSLEIQPSTVTICSDETISLDWDLNCIIEIKDKHDLVNLYIQFQKYLDTINDLELIIEIVMWHKRNDYGHYELKESSSIEFSEKIFNKQGVINVILENNCENYWIGFDPLGKMIYLDDSLFVVNKWE